MDSPRSFLLILVLLFVCGALSRRVEVDDDEDFGSTPQPAPTPVQTPEQIQQQQQKMKAETFKLEELVEKARAQAKKGPDTTKKTPDEIQLAHETKRQRMEEREKETKRVMDLMKEGENKLKANRFESTKMALYDSAQALFKENGDVSTLITTLQECAAANNTLALVDLGNLYFYGTDDGIALNFTEAIKYYSIAAELGNPEAQRQYAFMLDTGKGIEANKILALLYYTFAARSHDIEASHVLGYKYLKGKNVERSCLKAVDYYRFVAEESYNQYINRGYDVSTVTIDQINKDIDTMALQLEKKTTEIDEMIDFKAAKFDPTALLYLGTAYLFGSESHDQDFDEAFRKLSGAADSGNIEAPAYLGFMYEKGLGVAQDNATALRLYKQSASLKGAVGMTHMARVLLFGLFGEKVDYKLALEYLSAASQLRSYPETFFVLGQVYYSGLGVVKNHELAYKNFLIAAQNGNLGGQFHLARVIHNGVGANENCDNAAHYYKMIAEKGEWRTEYTRAFELYEQGDVDRALVLYEKLAEKGFDLAQKNAAYLYESGTLDVYGDLFYSSSEEQMKKAFRYYSFSSDTSPVSQLKIGDFYYYGWGGVEVDHAKSFMYYKHASELHNPQATYNVGFMHQFGLGIEEDLLLAKRYFDLALSYNPYAVIPVFVGLFTIVLQLLYKIALGESSLEALFLAFSAGRDLTNQKGPSPDTASSSHQPSSSPSPSGSSVESEYFDQLSEDDEATVAVLTFVLATLLVYFLFRRLRPQ